MDDMVEATIEKADMNTVFYWCVDTLKFFAARWGMTYEELNVWVFCIIGPIIFTLTVFIILVQARKLSVRKKLLTHLYAGKEPGIQRIV